MSRQGSRADPAPDAACRFPNFLVIGAMKAGTTSLYHYMRDHPQVFMPETKEVNFFNPHRNWRRGVEWYQGQFHGVSDDAVAVGEASTSYTKFPWIDGVPERIRSVLGEVRLIYVVRQPVERMRSQYLHHLATGQERRPIEEAFREEPMYLNISLYALQIERYLPHFPRKRLLVLDSRDLRDRRATTLRRVFEFLGVDAGWVPATIDREFLRSADRRMNPRSLQKVRRIPNVRTVSTYVPVPLKRLKHRLSERLPTQELDVDRADISEDLRRRLRESLSEDVARLRTYMDDGFDGWGIA